MQEYILENSFKSPKQNVLEFTALQVASCVKHAGCKTCHINHTAVAIIIDVRFILHMSNVVFNPELCILIRNNPFSHGNNDHPCAYRVCNTQSTPSRHISVCRNVRPRTTRRHTTNSRTRRSLPVPRGVGTEGGISHMPLNYPAGFGCGTSGREPGSPRGESW